MRIRKSESDDSILERLSKSSLDFHGNKMKVSGMKLTSKLSMNNRFSLMHRLSKMEPLNEL